MDIETFRNYCLQKAGVTEEFPFDESVLAFKVMGKVFALTNIDDLALSVNLKCDPEKALELRSSYSEVEPGYHMHKKHWNTVAFEGSVPDKLLIEWIDHSYDLVVKGLTKAARQELEKSQYL